ncbi:hypothetical protein GCM10020254_11940 [Streptomyces goshikiensis]
MRAARPGDRAWHPAGAADADGFASTPPLDGDGRAEIGYDLVPSGRGAGHATEALRALCAWAFAQPGVSALYAGADDANAPSAPYCDAPASGGPGTSPAPAGTR